MHAGTHVSSREDLANPDYTVVPRFWISEEDVRAAAGEAPHWSITFRNAISAVADSRSLVATIIPYAGAGNSMPIICLDGTPLFAGIVAGLNSLIVDYVLRQKACGGNLNYYVFKQLPFPPPESMKRSPPWDKRTTITHWIHQRLIELTYTAWDLQEYATHCLHEGGPFRWDDDRRFLSAVRSMLHFFSCLRWSEMTWTTSWRRSPSSSGEMRRNTVSTAPSE